MQYPINEMFQTLQGEGYFTGVPAIFIRLQGCPVGCAWCDTKHTWEKLEDREVSLFSISFILFVASENSSILPIQG
ncbi:hypothetical protein C9E21_29480 [Escherichia coli]|nr:hypothetical protein C9E21_29480 [Escherichia coli]